MSQPASLVEAVRVVCRLESARKACQAVPSVEKKKSLNVVSASADGDKISNEIRELKEIVLGMNEKIRELERKAETASTTRRRSNLTSRRMPRHIRDLNVESARDFKFKQAAQWSNNKENDPKMAENTYLFRVYVLYTCVS